MRAVAGPALPEELWEEAISVRAVAGPALPALAPRGPVLKNSVLFSMKVSFIILNL